MFDGTRIAELIARLHRERAIVVDLGSGPDALDADILSVIDRLCLVAGPSVAQLQSAFCAVPLLEGVGVRVGVVVVGAEPEDAARIARRLPWPLRAAIPRDQFLADDQFATRLPTLRAVDALIRSLA